MTFAPSDLIQRSPEALAASIDQETIVLDVASLKYLSLNPVATEIWQALEHPTTVADLCARLHASFDAPVEIIQADVLAFLERMEAKGLLVCLPIP